ncbi:hypothetical protein FEM48_Zijuj03G0047100 [Ziziphus jujuba var. spinosa]|uniref:UMP kinase n=1 Tax=Ziziphus jujuba var. spinosa TaxID=714518 RepID=A0A978VN89_ZIZJJ|nr:hypothetical protein FEM48_Zijuj03G0047100 [Ziziphus jujuba var. spinosa]
MASSEDFSLIDDDSHLHTPTRHHHTDSGNGDYFPPPPFTEDSDPNISGSAVGAPATSEQSPYYCKKLKSCSSAGNNSGKNHNNNEGESSGGTENYRRGGGGGDYRKDREEWSDMAIACLLDAYTEKFNQLSRGNLRGRDWEEVAEMVSERCISGGGEKHGSSSSNKSTYKSVEQCKNKIDNLKKRYKVELQRMSNGSLTVSHWHWFKKIEAIVGSSVAVKSGSDEERSVGVHSNVARQSKRYMSSNAAFSNNAKSKPVTNLKWRRVVFKISGAALVGDCQNIDPKVAMQIAREVATACRLGVEVAIVVGGCNLFCGDSWVSTTGLDRSTAYQIGMMATVMNSVLLQSALEKMGVQTRVQSAFTMLEVSEPYNRQRAIRHLEKGRVVIFGGVGAGAGNYLFTTDIAAALRASELNADVVLKGTNISGVYGCHSGNNSVTADHISYGEFVSRGITSMDSMAVTYCEENGIPVVIFNLLESGNISRALCGDQVGILIDQAGRIN